MQRTFLGFPVLNIFGTFEITSYNFFSCEPYYSECPQGRPCLGFGRVSFFFFFVVSTNRHINLCIKICPPLVGMYCSDCLQQKRPNQNLLFRHISRERGPTHPFLCDVKSSFDLFIKPSLNSALSQKGSIVLIVFNKNSSIKINIWRVYHLGGEPLISTCVTSMQITI